MPDSLWYAVAVSICRYPACSAWAVTCGACTIADLPGAESEQRHEAVAQRRGRLCVVVCGHSRTLSEPLRIKLGEGRSVLTKFLPFGHLYKK